MVKRSENNLKTENFNSRNYEIIAKEIQPKISFSYHNNHRFSAFYHFKNKVNTLQDFESLNQQKFGLDYFHISKKKNQISANATVFLNDLYWKYKYACCLPNVRRFTAWKKLYLELTLQSETKCFSKLKCKLLGKKK